MATKSLNDFYQEITKDGFKLTNQFQVSIDVDTKLKLTDKYVQELRSNITYLIDSAAIPSVTTEGTTIKYMALEIPIPTSAVTLSQEIELTAKCRKKIDITTCVNEWILKQAQWKQSESGQELSNLSGKRGIPNSKIHIIQYDDDMSTVLTHYILHGVFPVGVSPSEVTNSESNIQTVSIKFKYAYWTTTTTE